jgi:hypothetical protein
MWARVAELMIGVWLMLSPFVFRGTESIERFIPIDLAAGLIVIVLSLLSFWRRTEWAHLVTVGLALALGAWAYLAFERPGPPAAQNEITVAILLILLGIIPNEASRPPRPWRVRNSEFRIQNSEGRAAER